MERVIITGAGGFIGKALVQLLLHKGIYVIGVDINDKNLKDINTPKFKFIKASFTDYENLENLISERQFDVFYHFAWNGVFGEPFKDYDLQLKNAKYACDAIVKAKQIGCKKFVLAGTMNQYETLNYMKQFDIQPRYTCIYSTAKIAADMICKTIAYNEGIEFNAGLIAMAYGENNKSMMIPNVVIKSLLNDEPLKLIEGNNLYDIMYIDDIVNAFYYIGINGVNQKDYYIGHKIEDLKTFKKWIESIRDILSPQSDLLFGEFPDATEFDYNAIDTFALYEDTGYSIESDYKENIIKTANWIKDNMMEDK